MARGPFIARRRDHLEIARLFLIRVAFTSSRDPPFRGLFSFSRLAHCLRDEIGRITRGVHRLMAIKLGHVNRVARVSLFYSLSLSDAIY